ncbi:MAG: helix-turn-helix transcriptional regulator [Lachnospiraceae bacterium]|nr:helix-turn-helix transcriptional regulator [Lachnospiraceae bacterium]
MNDKYKFDAISFGIRLAKIRKFYELTQEQVAESIDVSVKSVQNWENGIKLPGIDNMVSLAELFGLSVGEILEDEAYRIFEKKARFRKRSIEIVEIPNKIEVYMEFTEDRFMDRYEVWVWDELARVKYLYCTLEKVISYKELKESMLDQAETIVRMYREWLLSTLNETEEDIYVKSEMKEKVSCENAGMASHGAMFINGGVMYFGD